MNADTPSQIMAEGIKQEKIRRAMLAGPSCVTSEATVAELNLDGSMTVLRPGTGRQEAWEDSPAGWPQQWPA